MASLDLLDLRDRLNDFNALMSFNGPLSESIIKDLGDAVRRYLEEEAASRATVMDVFSVFIEQTQNIRQYATSRGGDDAEFWLLSSAISVISANSSNYFVSSGNWVREADLPDLTAHLDRLRSLDGPGLKKLYKEVLRSPAAEGATTAGLGLIDMARKSSQPLSYSCREPDRESERGYVFFSLQATL
ncbi:SiaB family protein kinase [Thiohalorhabdus methylotrophus]|uniref:SiaB family protein kinase n=1 Tax=Thiohalorhabdus methylotrophus TaxID=3242694 RepID=A0ABV4TTS6_9GAMM